jgi:hypothetical protein
VGDRHPTMKRGAARGWGRRNRVVPKAAAAGPRPPEARLSWAAGARLLASSSTRRRLRGALYRGGSRGGGDRSGSGRCAVVWCGVDLNVLGLQEILFGLTCGPRASRRTTP